VIIIILLLLFNLGAKSINEAIYNKTLNFLLLLLQVTK
jgi:hypothetical protein